MFDAVLPQAEWWLVLHVLQILLFGLLVVAVWLLVDGLSGWLPRVARISSACFAATIIAYDSVQGIATGILIQAAQGLPSEQQAVYRVAVATLNSDTLAGNVSVLAVLAIILWGVAVLSAAAALSVAGAPFPAIVLLAITIVGPHNRPTGTLAMVCFLAAAAWIEFSAWAKTRDAAPVPADSGGSPPAAETG